MPASRGVEALVPPSVIQPGSSPANPLENAVSYTAMPWVGSAVADRSATVRCAQPESACQLGLATKPEQPLPDPDHAFSVHPRWVLLRTRVVPPTLITVESTAGKLASPYPE